MQQIKTLVNIVLAIAMFALATVLFVQAVEFLAWEFAYNDAVDYAIITASWRDGTARVEEILAECPYPYLLEGSLLEELAGFGVFLLSILYYVAYIITIYFTVKETAVILKETATMTWHYGDRAKSPLENACELFTYEVKRRLP